MSENAAPPHPGPYRTAEVRWFVPGTLPDAVAAWFDALGPPVEEDARTDRYLAGTGDALGLKVREGRVEAKRFEGGAGEAHGAPAEAWAKWLFPVEGDPAPPEWTAVRKRRRQRRVEAEGGSCAVEVSEVEAAGETWWSVCLEASGPTADARRGALAQAAARWLREGAAPALDPEAALSYPAWLARLGA